MTPEAIAGARSVSGHSQIVGVDVLRFLAAALVAIYHLAYISWADPDVRGSAAAAPYLVFRGWAPAIDTGWVGVQIFFVISGFVIAYTANGRSPADFVIGRALRLVPGVWLCATASVAALLLSGQAPAVVAKAWALSLVFFPTGPWVASSYWTLPVEIVFYTLVLLVLARDRFSRMGTVATWLGLSSLLLWGWLAVHPLLGLDHANHVEMVAFRRIAPLLLIPHGCFFATGVFFWLVTVRGPSFERIAMLLLFAATGVLQIDNETARATGWSGVAAAPVVPIALFCGSLLIIAASIRWNAAVHRLVGARAAAIRTLGLMTYPLYLLHQPFGEPLMRWGMGAGVPPIPALLLAVAVVLALSWLVAAHLEPRLRRVLRPILTASTGHLGERLPWTARRTQAIA